MSSCASESVTRDFSAETRSVTVVQWPNDLPVERETFNFMHNRQEKNLPLYSLGNNCSENRYTAVPQTAFVRFKEWRHSGLHGCECPKQGNEMNDLNLPERERGTLRGRALQVGTHSIGAIAVGAIAAGALALGAVAIGCVVIGRAKIRRLEIGQLIVGRLRVTDEIETP